MPKKNRRSATLSSCLAIVCWLAACQAGQSKSREDGDERGGAGEGGQPAGGRDGTAGQAGNEAGQGGTDEVGGTSGAAGADEVGGAGGEAGQVVMMAGAGGAMPVAGNTGGVAGAGGQPSSFDPKSSFASAFHGHRWEVPCQGEGYAPGDTCRWDPQKFSQNTKKVTTFTGEPGRPYDVGIRIRGVVEPRTYLVDGKVFDPGAKPAFLAGGTPAPGNDYNVYRIVVSKPAKTYHLNAYRSVGHYVFDIDYQAVIRIEGGAMVSLEAQDSNMEAIANQKRLVVPGIPPAPAPFNGQFIQLDVTSVAAVP